MTYYTITIPCVKQPNYARTISNTFPVKRSRVSNLQSTVKNRKKTCCIKRIKLRSQHDPETPLLYYVYPFIPCVIRSEECIFILFYTAVHTARLVHHCTLANGHWKANLKIHLCSPDPPCFNQNPALTETTKCTKGTLHAEDAFGA